MRFSPRKVKLHAKERFMVQLDKLFNTLTCNNQIINCEEEGCGG